MITKYCIDKIISCAKIKDVVEIFYQLKKVGASYEIRINNDKITISVAKNIYKNWMNDDAGGPVKFLEIYQKMPFIEAIKFLAGHYNIELEYEDKTPVKPSMKLVKPKLIHKSFRDIQLEQSCISDANQKALVYKWDEKTQKFIDDKQYEVDIYQRATKNQLGEVDTITPEADDMVIWYYDLNGYPVLFEKPSTKKKCHFYRFRWQNPEFHLDKTGKPKKYESPWGSSFHHYYPEIIRNLYKRGSKITTLYIQEGEKKADSATIHGLPSIGIPGIHALATNGNLPSQLISLINKCQVENVCFILDSDYLNLSSELNIKESVDKRSYSFFYAARNYLRSIKSLQNQGIFLKTYLAAVNEA